MKFGWATFGEDTTKVMGLPMGVKSSGVVMIVTDIILVSLFVF
jgi:hypothetical protein